MSDLARERIYTESEVGELVAKALKMGLLRDGNRDVVEDLPISELERLVSTIQ